MTDYDVFIRIIKNNYFIKLEDLHNKKSVMLKEEQSPRSRITITGLPTDSIIINIDKIKIRDEIFNCNNHECRCADYVVVTETKKRIIFIELKTTKDDKSHVIDQLKGGECLFNYIIDVGRKFFNTEFIHNYDVSFVSLLNTCVARKRVIKQERVRSHNTPENFLAIPGNAPLQFQHLL